MRHLIAEGAIGTPLHFRAWRFSGLGMTGAGVASARGVRRHRRARRHDVAPPRLRALPRRPPRQGDGDDEAHSPRTPRPRRPRVPADVEDWVAMVGTFRSDATAVLESTKIATGRGEGAEGEDLCEVNGTEGTAIYRLGDPLHIQIAQGRQARTRAGACRMAQGAGLAARSCRRRSAADVSLRSERRVHPGDRRRPRVRAHRSMTACACQAVMDAIMQSAREGRAVNVDLTDW